jgi:heat shock protein HslJ
VTKRFGPGARWRVIVLIASLVLVLVACDFDTDADTRSDTAGVPHTRQDIEAHEWELTRSSVGIDAGKRPTFELDDDAGSGQAPCNRWNGQVDVDHETIEIRNIAQTMMACEEPIMRADQAYVTALEKVDTVEVSDKRMVLSNGNGLRLEFRAAN